MHLEQIIGLLTQKFGQGVILAKDTNATPPAIVVPATHIAVLCQELYENEQTYFDSLACLTAIDNGPEVGTLEVIYNLYSIPYNVSLMIKIGIPRNKPNEPLPEVLSVSHLWQTANWHEREAYDLVGIRFINHPDLRRILLPADWEGHPLRKDYTCQEHYQGLKVPSTLPN